MDQAEIGKERTKVNKGQWKKGQSGNLHGRPLKDKPISADMFWKVVNLLRKSGVRLVH